MWNIYLYFIILKLFTNFQNIIFLVKIVANASLTELHNIQHDRLHILNIMLKTAYYML